MRFIRVLSLAAILTIAASTASALQPGDVDGDGTLTLYDATPIKNHLLEIATLTGDALTRADANLDGKVTMADVVYVTTHHYQPQELTVTLPGDVPLVMVKIPAGAFQMGSSDTERARYSDEGPVHTVTIGSDFYMGKYELTQLQWLAVMGRWPDTAHTPNYEDGKYGLGDNYPAYFISWNDCQSFITALNAHISSTGQGPATFRLPSEAEWEYACRAGTQTRFFFGDSLSVGDSKEDGPAGTLPGNRSDYMWYSSNINTPTYGSKPVGTKLPNQFGLYDMSGNLWVWCKDWYHESYTGAPADGSAWESPTGSYRVLRGGGWGSNASGCRSAYRDATLPVDGGNHIGLRLSRTQ